MYRNGLRRIALLAVLATLLPAAACTDGWGLNARRVERQDELIGGPNVLDHLNANNPVQAFGGQCAAGHILKHHPLDI